MENIQHEWQADQLCCSLSCVKMFITSDGRGYAWATYNIFPLIFNSYQKVD